MRRLQIKHVTNYQYAEAVTLLPHKLLLRPREGHDIRIESVELDISPAHQLVWQRDVYDNALAQVTFDGNINSAGAPIFKLSVSILYTC